MGVLWGGPAGFLVLMSLFLISQPVTTPPPQISGKVCEEGGLCSVSSPGKAPDEAHFSRTASAGPKLGSPI